MVNQVYFQLFFLLILMSPCFDLVVYNYYDYSFNLEKKNYIKISKDFEVKITNMCSNFGGNLAL